MTKAKHPYKPLIFSMLCLIFLFGVLCSGALARSYRVGLLPEKARPLGCSVCHLDPRGGGARNPFGKDFEKLALPSGDKMTEALLKTDSDGDGISNDSELNAGTFPGNPGSLP